MVLELKQIIVEFFKRTERTEMTREGLKTVKINNRRYLGNKYKLLPFIKNIVEKECLSVETVADIFAGTGSVASAFADKVLITNDLLYSNYVCNYAWFSPEKFRKKVISDAVEEFNSYPGNQSNYMTENFSDTYFSAKDCSKIGQIREEIETKFRKGEINMREKAVLIAALIYAMDKIAKTCGHYDAYRKGVEFDMSLSLAVPEISDKNNKSNICFNEDSNELVKRISADLVYIDPPYNSRQYSDAYHLLENVARWEKPEVYGVAKKMNRSSIKSKYCTSQATAAFKDLILNISARYILLSYNNMASKGHERSNAKISDEDITEALSGRGDVKIFSERYKAFTAGKSDINGNEERLFLCTVKNPIARE